MTKKGIDVSVWNGEIDWKQVKQQVDFAIIRIGYGKFAYQKDKNFETNYKGCKDNYLPCGGYWYCYATTVEEAKAEAQTCLEVLNGKKFDYPIWYDIEENVTFATGAYTTSTIAKTFCDILAAAGHKVGVYSSKWFLQNYFTTLVKNNYDIWVANVGANGATLESTTYTGHTMWQFSWKGEINGIKGDVDLDYCYKDYLEDISSSNSDVFPNLNSPMVAPPSMESEAKPVAKPQDTTKAPDVYYCSYVGYWLSEIKNYNDENSQGYSGIKNRPLSGFAAKVDGGTISYRVHLTNGKWLGWINQYDIENWAYGCAGIRGHNIDCLQMKLNGLDGYEIQYRASTVNSKDYLPWVTGVGANEYEYAGIYGRNIDRIQARIVKV